MNNTLQCFGAEARQKLKMLLPRHVLVRLQGIRRYEVSITMTVTAYDDNLYERFFILLNVPEDVRIMVISKTGIYLNILAGTFPNFISKKISTAWRSKKSS